MTNPAKTRVKVGAIVWCMLSLDLNEQVVAGYEQLGMDSVWVIDHLLGVYHPGLWSEMPASAMLDDPDAFLDPFCVASVVGRNTNMLLGSSVVDLTRRRPIDFARSVLTVHHGAKHGFIFGIGSGLELNLAPFGYDITKRVSRFEESIKELRCLLDTGRMPDGVGRVGLPLESEAGRPQVWVAGNAPRVHRIAGQYGDGWITLNVPPEQYAKDRAAVLAAASAAGRPQPVCALSPWVFLGPSRSAIAAKLEAVPVAKLNLLFASAALWKRYGLEHPTGPDAKGYTDAIPHAHDPAALREVASRIPFEMFEEYVILGNAAEVAAQLQPYADAGCEHFILGDLSALTGSAEEAAGAAQELANLRLILTGRLTPAAAAG